MSDRSPALLARIGALAILGLALLIGAAAVASPLWEAWQRREQALERRAGFEAMLDQPQSAGVRYDPADLYAIAADEGAATIGLQTTLDRIARAAGVAVQSVRPMAAEDIGASVQSSWVELQLIGDLEALIGLLAALEAKRPALLVRRVDVIRGEGPRPDLFLQIRMEAGQAWRVGAGDAT